MSPVRTLRVASLLAFTSIMRGNINIVLLTILILVLVANNLLFVPSLLEGLVAGANDKVRETYSGDVVVEPADATELLRDVDNLLSRIKAIPGVAAATPRNRLGAAIEFEDERVNGSVYGIVPDSEQAVFTTHQRVIEGSYLSPSDRDQILLGIQLAGADNTEIEFYSQSLRKVHAGDRVSVTYANGIEKGYTVKGILHTEFISTDLQALVTEKEFLSLNPLARDRASSIHVKLAPGADAGSVMRAISGLRGDLRALGWEEFAGIVRSMTTSFNVINTILNVVNLLVAGFTIFIVTYIDVAGRRRQIGIQRAIGITPAAITLSYMLRAMFYAIIGAILAMLLFIYLVVPLEMRHPFRFPFGAVYLEFGLPDMVRTGLVLLGVAMLSSFIPVRGTMRIKILDAIWG